MLCVWISDDMKIICSRANCGDGAMPHQDSTNPLAPALRLYKQSIKLKFSIRARNNGREPLDSPSLLCHEDFTSNNLPKWQFDGIWIGQQSCTSVRVVE